MFKLLKNIGCLSIIILVIFLIVALISGGGKIREIGDKTTGVVKKVFHYAADKADHIHQSLLKKIEEYGKPFKHEPEKTDTNKKP